MVNRNKRTETLLLVLTAGLFLLAMASFISAVVRAQYFWSIPSAAGSLFLKWPLQQIARMRKRNIALLSAPIFLTNLPPNQAAKEIQKILQELFKDGN